jgi:16S rRNA (guanine527-N7)-methyltransferase
LKLPDVGKLVYNALMPWQTFILHAREMGVSLSPEQFALFRAYTERLLAANRRINLTALRDETALIRKFHLDALALLPVIARYAGQTPDTLRTQAWLAADVGSGGGAPALPLSILWPELRYTLIESIAKKARFLAETASALGLEVSVLTLRAEDAGQILAHRQRYHLVTARAVAALPTLVELTLPLAAVGGLILLPKGPKAPDEVAAAAAAITLLGGKLAGVERVTIPDTPEERQVVVIEKVAETPKRYPRRAGVPGRRPLHSKALSQSSSKPNASFTM